VSIAVQYCTWVKKGQIKIRFFKSTKKNHTQTAEISWHDSSPLVLPSSDKYVIPVFNAQKKYENPIRHPRWLVISDGFLPRCDLARHQRLYQ